MSRPLVVLHAAGLTPALLSGVRGFRAQLDDVPPAAGTAQAMFLTGGSGEPLWVAARQWEPGYRVANLGWEHGLGGVDLTVTTRGRDDCSSTPPILYDRLRAEFGPFPGSGDPEAPVWLAGAVRHVLETDAPDLTLVALPHLHDEAAGAVLAVAGRRAAAVVVLSADAVLLCSDRTLRRDRLASTQVRDLLLAAARLPAPSSA